MSGFLRLPWSTGSVLVSCQAAEEHPLHGPVHMAAMARAAEVGGAAGVRVEGSRDVAAVAAAVRLPIVGIRKRRVPDSPVYITPTLADAIEVVEAGAHMVAIDATDRRRPGGVPVRDLIARIRGRLAVPVMADVDEVGAGIAAAEAGAACVATTLSGYTDARPSGPGPDVDLVAALTAATDCPVVAEGRYSTPGQVRAALEAGADAVVVGTAITDPVALTRRFVEAAR